MRSLTFTCFILILISPLAGCVARSSEGGDILAKNRLAERVYRASATVLRDGQIAGSGSFVSEDGLFLSAAHVVHNPADRVELLLTDGRVVPAKPIASDLGHDLVLLKAELKEPLGAKPLELAGALPEPGADLMLVAAPSMIKETFLPGKVARNRIGFNFLGDRESYTRTLLIAADAMPGSSGGCWVNVRGQIVGVQSAVSGDGKASHGLAMIVPASAAKRLIAQQTDQPTATLGGEFVGLWTQAYGFNKRFPKGATGVALHRAFEDGPVAKAGIPKDHLITHIDGRPTPDSDTFVSIVRERKPGGTLRLKVISPDSHEEKIYDVTADELTWD